jgi:hypothetical protein
MARTGRLLGSREKIGRLAFEMHKGLVKKALILRDWTEKGYLRVEPIEAAMKLDGGPECGTRAALAGSPPMQRVNRIRGAYGALTEYCPFAAEAGCCDEWMCDRIE